jgi:hypothetical protein
MNLHESSCRGVQKWDEVRLELSTRREVIADTVRVTVTANVSVTGEDTARVRGMLNEALSSVVPGDWIISAVTRQVDEAGMERVHVVTSLRMPEHQAAGLADRLKRASRPGLALQLGEVRYQPPRTELDRVERELRGHLYREAQREADLLNEVLPDAQRRWSIGEVDFGDDLRSRAGRGSASMHMIEAAEADDGPDLSTGTRIAVTASVTLRRPAPVVPAQG